MSNAIYSGVPGASLESVEGLGQIWLIPCDAEINITFKIGGQTYPVHPLDTNSDDALTNPDGQTCLGAVRLVVVHLYPHHVLKPRFQFQPISSGASPTFDLILGTSFRKFHDCSPHHRPYIYTPPLLVTPPAKSGTFIYSLITVILSTAV